MVESTIDKIKDITVERQIRKLAGIIDEQNKKIDESVDFSTDIENLKTSDANQNTEINNLKTTSAVHTTDIDNLKASDTNQTTQINNLKQSVATDKLATEAAITALQNKDAAQDGTLTDQAILIQGLTESLVSNVQIIPGTTTGDIKVRLEKESAPDIDSNDYNLGLPVSAEIIQGTGPSMFKIQLTMSSGVKVISNDFVFTTEAIGTDVYISSFTFKAGNQDGYLSADIGLNNGVTIEANNFLVPTDPAIISSIEDLRTSLGTKADLSNPSQTIRAQLFSGTSGSFNTLYAQNAKFVKSGSNNITLKQTGNNKNPIEVVETSAGGDVTIGNMAFIDSSGNPLNFSVGEAEVAELKATVEEHTASINTLNSDVADLQINKADVNNGNQSIVAGSISATNITKGGVEVATINDIPTSSGEVWEEVDLSNIPHNWVVGDKIKVCFKIMITSSSPYYGVDSSDRYSSNVIECYFDKLGTRIINTPIMVENPTNFLILYNIGCSAFNAYTNQDLFNIYAWNNGTMGALTIDRSNITTYVRKLWRLKK